MKTKKMTGWTIQKPHRAFWGWINEVDNRLPAGVSWFDFTQGDTCFDWLGAFQANLTIDEAISDACAEYDHLIIQEDQE